MSLLLKSFLVAAIFLPNIAFGGYAKETCKTIKPIENFDYNEFKLEEHKNQYTKWYTYLTDQVMFEFINEEKTKARFISIDLVLMDENKTVINFSETNAHSDNGSCWTHYEEVFYDTIEVNYNINNKKLYAPDIGEGMAVLCDGTPALQFTYANNIGPSDIENKTFIITYGRSNISPVETIPTLLHPCH